MKNVSIEDLNKVINSENKKNPLTDEKIAELFGVNRKKITELRLEGNIPDSRDRKRESLYKDAEETLKKYMNISDRQFTKLLNEQGYSISRYTSSQIKNELIKRLKSDNLVTEKVPKLKKEANEKYYEESENSDKHVVNKTEELSPFSEIIGYDGYL